MCHSIRSMFRVLGIYNFASLTRGLLHSRKNRSLNFNFLGNFEFGFLFIKVKKVDHICQSGFRFRKEVDVIYLSCSVRYCFTRQVLETDSNKYYRPLRLPKDAHSLKKIILICPVIFHDFTS